MFVSPDVSPDAPLDQQPTIGLIGMGAMGTLYAKHLSAAGWQKCVISMLRGRVVLTGGQNLRLRPSEQV